MPKSQILKYTKIKQTDKLKYKNISIQIKVYKIIVTGNAILKVN